MNTAAKALAQSNLTSLVGIRALVFSKTMLYSTGMVTAILLSALGIIYVKEQQRGLLSDVSRLQHVQNKLQVRQGQLLLEENTLMAQHRLETVSQDTLNMTLPKTTKVILVTR